MRHPIAIVTALTTLLGLAACAGQQAPPQPPACCTPKPVRPAASESTAPSPAPSMTPSAAPSVATSPAPATVDAGAFDLNAPLPAPSTSSDLAGEEDSLVNAALASDELAGYLSTELIHDGGVVLYRLLGPAGGGLLARADEGGGRAPGRGERLEDVPREEVDAETRKRPVLRKVEKRGGRQLELERACEAGEDCKVGNRRVRAGVVVRQVARAEVTDTAGKTSVRTYAEVFRRTVMLRPETGRMRLEAVSPFTVQAAGQLKGLEVQAVSFGLPGATPLLAWRPEDKPRAVAETPLIPPGASLRVQVRVDQPSPSAVVVLAGFPGQPWGERTKLVPVGVELTSGEFAGTVKVPAREGATHVIVEVVDARSLLPTQPYRSLSLGFSARVVTTPP